MRRLWSVCADDCVNRADKEMPKLHQINSRGRLFIAGIDAIAIRHKRRRGDALILAAAHCVCREASMRRNLNIIGASLFLLLSLFMIAFGGLYASVNKLLWFHAAAVPQHALEAVRPLYFALMKLIGGASIALGVLGAFLTVERVRRGDRRAAAALFIVFAIPLAVAAYVAEELAAATGSPTSWHVMGVLFAINAAALLASLAGAGPRDQSAP